MSLRSRLPFLGSSASSFDQGDDAMVRWLEAVGAEAYPSDAERVARVRERILLQARVAHREAGAARESTPRRPFLPGRLGSGRRAAVLAFGLVLASVGAVAGAESGPGEAFYGARLAVEDVTLPPAGTPEGVDARLDSLRRRLSEAAAASASGDERAAAAALGAYRSRLARLFHADAGAVDVSGLAASGVELPDVAARLSEDDDLVRSLGKALGQDQSAATVVIGEMDRIRSAIADQVARDTEARDKAGSGNGPGPRVTTPNGNGKVKGKPVPSPSSKSKKRPVRVSPVPSASAP